MKKAIIAFISLIIFCIEPLMASAEFSFKKYQVENGLSHNTTWCAIQDSYGFLWIGTSNGLNCYYGSGNKIYRNVLNDKYSLGNNFVGSLMEEGEDLWIGTSLEFTARKVKQRYCLPPGMKQVSPYSVKLDGLIMNFN